MTGLGDTVSSLFSSIAVLAIACAGLAAILRLTPLRDRFLGWAIIAVAASVIVSVLKNAAGSLATDCELNAGVIAPGAASRGVLTGVVLGHLALAAILLVRRVGGVERARRRAADIERARTRGRARLSPGGEEREP